MPVVLKTHWSMAIVANLNAIGAKCESESNAEVANGQLESYILFMVSLLEENSTTQKTSP